MFDELIEQYEINLDMLDSTNEFNVEKIAYLNGIREGILMSMEIVDWDRTMEYLDKSKFEVLDFNDED